MNNQEVYIVTDDDEMYLGTVGEITGTESLSDTTFKGVPIIFEPYLDPDTKPKLGQGMSLAAIFSDIVSEMASGGERRKVLSLHLREPYYPGVE